VGKMKDLRGHLATQAAREQGRDNVIYLRHCELCGRLAKGEICRRCEPMFRR
jgi:recombinational DNA repair protein RecR